MNRKNLFKKCAAFLLSGVLLYNIAEPQAIAEAAPKKPQLSQTKITLNVKDSARLKVKKSWKKKVKKITFRSGKKKVASVSASGKITARKKGTAKITCKITLKNNKKYRVKCTVKVIAAPRLKASGMTLNTGKTAALSFSSLAKANVKKTTYRSNAPAVVSVSPKGILTGLRAGSAKVTAVIKMKSGKKYTLSCTVTVKNAPGKQNTPSQTPSSSAPASSTPPTAGPVVKPTAKPTHAPGTEHLSANGIKTKDNGIVRSDMTSFDLLHEMGLGINLGNTMESCGSWINGSSVSKYETAWGAPITTQEIISGMKNAGFHSVRIPVAWSNMMSDDGKYTIHEDYLNRVEEIINYALNENMVAIVNIHFDGGWWARFGSKDATERSEAMVKYKAIWTQIANRYKEYSDRLVFESANEELGGRLNSTDDYEGSGYFSTEDQLYELTNTINQTFVDIVRGSGGNNATRHLLIAGYNTDITKTCDSRFHMPTDTLENRLMISVHYYSPAPYCLVEDPENSWGFSDTWGTDTEVKEMQSALKTMKIMFADKGFPVVIGEYGVASTAKIENGKKTYIRKEGRDLFLKTMCEYALDHGMCPVLWSITGHIYDRESCQISHEKERENFKALEAHAEKNYVYLPEVHDTNGFVWEGDIGCSGWNPTSPIAGDNYNIFLNSVGGCYQLTGVDWTQLKKPQLTLHSDSLDASINYEISTSVNADNQYYQFIDSAKIKGTWAAQKDITIDLSTLGLTAKDSLYICFKSGKDFNGNLTLNITDK